MKSILVTLILIVPVFYSCRTSKTVATRESHIATSVCSDASSLRNVSLTDTLSCLTDINIAKAVVVEKVNDSITKEMLFSDISLSHSIEQRETQSKTVSSSITLTTSGETSSSSSLNKSAEYRTHSKMAMLTISALLILILFLIIKHRRSV